jgi:S-methylmethionine-dependent homocysteine/selenocysteine methylase
VVGVFVAGEAVLVADGGLETELEARGNDLSDALWSARADGSEYRGRYGRSVPSGYSPAQPRQWTAAGAAIIGGCCRVRPAGIAEIARLTR